MDTRQQIIGSLNYLNSLENKAVYALYFGLFFYFYSYLKPVVRRKALGLVI